MEKTDISWMDSLCYKDRDPSKPFGARVNGRQWAVATQGYTLTLVPFSKLPENSTITPAIGRLVEPNGNRQTVSWARVQAFIAVAECESCHGDAPPVIDCDNCSGEGTLECPSCEHESNCGACSGKGYIGGCSVCIRAGETPALGYVKDVAINRRLLAAAIGPLHADHVEVCSAERLDPVKLITDEWMVVIMPLNQVDGEGPTL